MKSKFFVIFYENVYLSNRYSDYRLFVSLESLNIYVECRITQEILGKHTTRVNVPNILPNIIEIIYCIPDCIISLKCIISRYDRASLNPSTQGVEARR